MADSSKQNDHLSLKNYTLRISDAQRSRIERAAAIESERQGVRVDPSRLIRDKGLEVIDAILAEHAPAQPAA